MPGRMRPEVLNFNSSMFDPLTENLTPPRTGGTPPMVSSTPQPQQSPRGQQARDEAQFHALKLRLDAVGAWILQIKQTDPETFDATVERVRAAGNALKDDNYGLASAQ